LGREYQRDHIVGIISFVQQQSKDRPQSDATSARAPDSLSYHAETKNPWEIGLRLNLLQVIFKT